MSYSETFATALCGTTGIENHHPSICNRDFHQILEGDVQNPPKHAKTGHLRASDMVIHSVAGDAVKTLSQQQSSQQQEPWQLVPHRQI